jgi:hypothetical protein
LKIEQIELTAVDWRSTDRMTSRAPESRRAVIQLESVWKINRGRPYVLRAFRPNIFRAFRFKNQPGLCEAWRAWMASGEKMTDALMPGLRYFTSETAFFHRAHRARVKSC